jgi:hypothetical protein
MRKLLLATCLLLGWVLPAQAQILRIPIPIATFCCQFGESYGATTFSETPSCKQERVIVNCCGTAAMIRRLPSVDC